MPLFKFTPPGPPPDLSLSPFDFVCLYFFQQCRIIMVYCIKSPNHHSPFAYVPLPLISSRVPALNPTQKASCSTCSESLRASRLQVTLPTNQPTKYSARISRPLAEETLRADSTCKFSPHLHFDFHPSIAASSPK